MKTFIFFATALSFYVTGVYSQPKSGGLLLTEIMADPTPVQGFLPDAEYVELWNRSEQIIELDQSILKIGNTSIILPPYALPPDAYIIFSKGPEKLADHHLHLARFPALNNAGANISLRNPNGELVFEVEYKDTWYRDSKKKSGGWSLELIDPDLPLNCKNNWIAHPSDLGGSPGKSVHLDDSLPDKTGPFINSFLIDTEKSIRIIFSEPMEQSNLDAIDHYLWINKQVHPHKVSSAESEVILTFEKSISKGELNYLEVYSTLTDCVGNSLTDTIIEFGLGKNAVFGDLKINEVMFDPLPECPAFIEIYNHSGEMLVLSDFELITGTAEKSLSLPAKFLEPDQWWVLTRDPESLTKCHPNLRNNAAIKIGTFSLSRSEGEIRLNFLGNEIEKISYSNDWHHPFLSPTRGTSLERISLMRPANQSNNWHSAAKSKGSATPGWPNSQAVEPSFSNNFVELSSTKITPNGDGEADFLLLHFRTDQPGYMLTISLFDHDGIPLGRIVNQERIPFEGTILWNGTNAENTLLRSGLYILFCQFIHPDGHIQSSKHLVTLEY
jgi:hypothetical protein